MKSIILIIVTLSASLAAAEPGSAPQQLRRAPYKEVRTKANHGDNGVEPWGQRGQNATFNN